MKATLIRSLTAALALTLISFASIGHASVVEEEPSAVAMATDAIFVRPALFVTTVAGGVIYVASLPFSLLGGNAAEAGSTLFLKPAEATFVRCLGCTKPGRKTEPVQQTDDN